MTASRFWTITTSEIEINPPGDGGGGGNPNKGRGNNQGKGKGAKWTGRGRPPWAGGGGGGGGGGDVTENTLTIPAQSSTLTDFVVYFDMSRLSAGFWAAVTGGAENVRVYESDGSTLVPHHVADFNLVDETGSLWIKKTLSTGSSTVLKVTATADTARIDDDAANGRQSVFSGYEAFFLGGGSTLNEVTGFGVTASITGEGTTYTKTQQTGDITEAHDGSAMITATSAAIFGDNNIAIWTDVFGTPVKGFENTDPAGDAVTVAGEAAGFWDAIGGGFYDHDGRVGPVGRIYLFPGKTLTRTGFAVYDGLTSGCPCIAAFDTSAEAYSTGAADCDADDDGNLVTIQFNSGAGATHIYKVDPADGTVNGSLSLVSGGIASTIVSAQGIVWDRAHNCYHVNAASNNEGVRIVNAFTGEITNRSWGDDGIAQGMSTLGGNTIFRHMATTGSNGIIQEWEPKELDLGGGGRSMTSATFDNMHMGGLSNLQDFTVGVSHKAIVSGSNLPIWSYHDESAGSANTRVTMWTLGAANYNTWEPGVGFSDTGQVKVTASMSRLVTTINSTGSAQETFFNGSSISTDSVSAIPATMDRFMLNVDDGSLNRGAGDYGFAYLRSGILSDDWIAAEYLMVDDNVTFLTVS